MPNMITKRIHMLKNMMKKTKHAKMMMKKMNVKIRKKEYKNAKEEQRCLKIVRT